MYGPFGTPAIVKAPDVSATTDQGVDAATIWVKDLPPWAKDAPHVTGKRVKGRIEGIKAAPATLFVIAGK